MTNIDINKIKQLPYHKEFITGEYDNIAITER